HAHAYVVAGEAARFQDGGGLVIAEIVAVEAAGPGAGAVGGIAAQELAGDVQYAVLADAHAVVGAGQELEAVARAGDAGHGLDLGDDIVLEHHVDDTGDGVRAVLGRGAV